MEARHLASFYYLGTSTSEKSFYRQTMEIDFIGEMKQTFFASVVRNALP